jgi:hypothetical protein
MSVLTAPVQSAVLGTKKAKMDSEEMLEGFDNINEHKLLVKKLSTHATLPTRGSSLAAGYDLYR